MKFYTKSKFTLIRISLLFLNRNDMKLKEFIENFSHNNEIYIENRERQTMSYKYVEEDKPGDIIMDWEAGNYSDIRDCEVIRISNVLRPGKSQGITIVVDTDRTSFGFDKSLVRLDNSPLWFYNKIHGTNVIGNCS